MQAARRYLDELRERAIRQAEADGGKRRDRLTTAEREEVATLPKENTEPRRANEILKAASAYFSRELDPTRPR